MATSFTAAIHQGCGAATGHQNEIRIRLGHLRSAISPKPISLQDQAYIWPIILFSPGDCAVKCTSRDRAASLLDKHAITYIEDI